MQSLYEEMADRIDTVIMLGEIPEALKANKGFSEWSSGMTSWNHPPVVQVLLYLVFGEQNKTLLIKKPLLRRILNYFRMGEYLGHDFKV